MTPNNQELDLEKVLEFVKENIKQAGEILMQNYEDPGKIEKKSDGTFITDIDKKVSSFLSHSFKKQFPQHAILDEEQVDDNTRFEKEYCWVIDPLDSTRAYVKRKEGFGVIIGLLKNHKPILGVTYNPIKDELAYAIKGKGSFLETKNEKRKLKVSTSEEIITLISSSRWDQDLEEILKKINSTKVTKMPGSLKLVEIAKGTANLFISPVKIVMHTWDLCGTALILEEAGGKITDIFGNKLDFSSKDTTNRKGIIASNSKIHQQILEKII